VWYRWTKVNGAKVPDDFRVQFEQLGETVVAQILGRPLSHAAVQTIGVPAWAGTGEQRQHALSWLREKHNEEDRRRDVNESMEVAISVLVAIEAIQTLIGWFQHAAGWLNVIDI
jgi:hypothetical protein